MMTFTAVIKKLLDGKSLSRQETQEAMSQFMGGGVTPVQMASFLTALRMKRETIEEITGAAEAMRNAAVAVHCKANPLVDTCGTGGDGQGSFNVSTAAAFVVAGAGFVVAKHGNRSVSSQCGSADVLEELGIPIQATPAMVEECLNEIGVAFLFAPAFHPAMKVAMPVRKELGVRTIFNLLGPLTNPARPNVQVVGVFEEAWVEPIAHVLVHLGCRNGAVVHGQGHDEVILSGPTWIAEIQEGHVRLHTVSPKDFGLRSCPAEALKGGDRQRNAEIILQILKGEQGPFRDSVCMNAAVAIRAATRQAEDVRREMTLQHAFDSAQTSIDQKKALGKLEALREKLTAGEIKHG